MRYYRRHACFVAFFLAAYLLLGGVFRFTRPGGEVFPVSSWTLFLYVPNRVDEYAVEILALGGAPLPQPLAFHEAKGLFPGAGNISAQQLVQRMGRASRDGDRAGLAELRDLFERRWLGEPAGAVRYRLVQQRYSPLERWRSGALLESRALERFESGGDPS